MTRVYHHRAGQGAHGSSTLDRTRAARKKKPYKVVMEVVTQEKKKLHSIMTYTANAPVGYTFVPLGNRDLTEYCKEKCRKRNLTAHIVSATPKGKPNRDPEKDSAARIDTQRIGHHFPNAVIDEACDVLGYYLRRGVFQKINRNYEETQLARSLQNYGQRMRLHGRPVTEGETKDQIRSAILEVFPKIPEADLNAIVGHAFEEGTNRVGNATELTLARRVQLAVGAYIRHQYTGYDTILKTGGSWLEARQKAQPLSYAKLREWRDEAESNELEETFREIIVLDDDDDDGDSETSDDTSVTDERAHSLEIVSSQATARELQPDDMASVGRIDAYGVSRHPRRMIVLRPTHRAPGSPAPFPSDAYSPRQVIRADARSVISDAPTQRIRPHNPEPVYVPHRHPAEAIPRTTTLEPIERVAPRPSQQYFRGADGKLYNLQPIEQPRANRQMVEYLPSPGPISRQNGYVQPARRVNSLDNTHHDRPAPPLSRRPSGDDVILPSIEREPEPLASPRRLPDNSGPMHHEILSSPPKRKAFPAVGYELNEHDQLSKRLKPVHHDMVPSHAPMFQRVHNREPADRRARVPLAHEVVDLTSSPHRVSDRSREVIVVPVRSSAADPSISRPPPPESSRNYLTHAPGYHRTIERYPGYEYDERRKVYPTSSYAAADPRYTRGNIQYDPRVPR